MSKNNEKKTENQPLKKEAVKPEKKAAKPVDKAQGKDEKKINNNKLAIIITSAILACILLAGIIIFAVVWISEDRGFSYEKSDMTKYVFIDEKDYKDFHIEVDIARPRDLDVESTILSLLASNKGDAIDGPNQVITSGVTITPGSIVKLWYRGYRLDKDGNEIEIEGLTNYTDSEAASIEVGLASFPAGFELGLVGLKLEEGRTRFKKITNGAVTAEQIVYVNYTKTETSTSKKTEATNVRIDLSSDVDATYGVGFKETLLSLKIGETKEFGVTDSKGVHSTYKLSVSFATEFEGAEDALILDTYFSYNTSWEELRNENVMFEVYIDSVQRYECDEFNDEFVQELVDRKESILTAETLNTYEGETLTEKYRDYLTKELNNAYEDRYEQMVQEALWEHLHSKATILKYPEYKVNQIYKSYIVDLERSYEQSGGSLWSDYYGQYVEYETFEKYAVAYYNFTASAQYPSWTYYVYDMAKMVVVERMIFYYIMQVEDYQFTQADFEKTLAETKQEYVDEYIEQYLSNLGKTREDFTDEEYAEFVYSCEVDVFSYYDDAYFEETTHYNMFIDTLVSWGTVSTLDDRSNLPQDK